MTIIRNIIWMLLFAGFSLPVASADEDIAGHVVKGVEEGFTELERRMIKRYYEQRHGKDINHDHDEDEDDDDRHGHKKKSKKDADHDDDDYGHKPKGKKDKHGKGLPPGLAKRDQLPPGLEKQLQKNGTLPPGLAKRDLPPDLEDRLGRPPEGYERTIVDNDVVLVEAATRKVVDIITDAVLGD